jgi:hypothetical protein
MDFIVETTEGNRKNTHTYKNQRKIEERRKIASITIIRNA